MELELIDFPVLITTCDQGSKNEGLAKQLGITKDKYLLRMSEETFDQVIEVNLKGTYLVNQICATALKEQSLPVLV